MADQSTIESNRDTRIVAPWLTVVRVIWFALVLAVLGLFIAGISPRVEELRTACAVEDCPVLSLSPEEADVLSDIGFSIESYAIYQVGLEILLTILFTSLAGLIFWRRSHTWIGIVVPLTLVFLGTVFFPGNISALVNLYPSLQLLADFLASISIVLLLLLFYLLPDGRFVPRWTRFFALVLASAILVDPFLSNRGPIAESASVRVVVLLVSGMAVGVVAQVYRYRRVSTPAQRQQTKWITLGLLMMFMAMLVWVIFAELFPLQPGAKRLAFNLSMGIQLSVIALFPLSMVFSILRYRLWGIDVVVNRALVYGVLTVTLVGAYFGSVVLLQMAFRGVTDQGGSVAVVISTLAIAALFMPLRRGVQNTIDRRFYRRKYDAALTLEAFSATARDEVDINKVTNELVAVVEEAMQPAHVSLWLRN